MFIQRIWAPKSEKKLKIKSIDVMTEQVKKVLGSSDQKLILMVRG